LKYQSVRCIILKFFLRYDFGMRLFFLTIPKPLKQHPINKKDHPFRSTLFPSRKPAWKPYGLEAEA
jgi:hypothetical protein